jgi:CBS domain containing-hemolysin-like protein
MKNLEALSEASVKEIMTPRVEVVAIEIPVTSAKLVSAIKRSGHSRYPVYEGDLDNMVGILFLKDLLREDAFWERDGTLGTGNLGGGGTRAEAERLPWSEDLAKEFGVSRPSSVREAMLYFSILRPPYWIPESRNALETMFEMQRARRDFGVVVDEHGSVSGVLTMKDILSRAVGDLPDEFDAPEPPPVVAIDRGRWLVDGAAPLEALETALGLSLPEGDYVTVGGYIMSATGEVPEVGQKVKAGNYLLTVVEVEKRRVKKLLVQALSDQEAHPAEAPRPEAGQGSIAAG